MKISALHRDRATETRPAKSNEIITEDSAAEQFASLYKGRLRYCHDTGAWFEWSGSAWKQNRTGTAFQWARELSRHLSIKEPDKVRFIASKTSFSAGVERFARSDPAFAVTMDHWDSHPFLLGTPDGTVDLKTGKLRPSNPDDGITKLTAVAPAETADCPRWLAFLADATGDDRELMRFLQQWAGYCLTADTREHALVFVSGQGGNGKSVWLNTTANVLRDYAAVAAMDTFTATRGDKHPTDVAMLHGARMVTASETEEGRSWAEARIKSMTGGDPITARFMRQDFFTFQPTFKLTIVGNHRPLLQNVDDAARRRFNIVPFNHKPASPDRELETKLRQEWPAILRWMIDGCLDWQANGLVRPRSVLAETEAYFSDQDLLGQWLDDECDVDLGNHWKTATSADLFNSWASYAKAANENAGSKKSFSEQLQRRGLEKYKGTGGARVFRGLRLNEQTEKQKSGGASGR